MENKAPAVFNLHSQENETSITRRDVLSVIFKHKSIILKSFVIVTILVTLGFLFLPPVYTVNGKILVKTERQGNPTFFSGVASYEEKRQADPVNRTMETEMELVEARPIAEDVVRRLDIKYNQVYHKPYVHLLMPVGNLLEPVLAMIGFPPDPKKQGFEDTVTELVKSISVAPVKSKSSETTSNIMEIYLRTHDRAIADKALLGIMEAYQKHNTMINRAAGERAYKIIEKRKQEAFTELLRNQAELEDFVGDTKSSQDIRGSKNTGRVLRSTSSDGESISLLKKQVLEKELELEELRQKYNSDHFMVQRLENAIANLRRRIQAETQKYATSDSKLRSLERKLEISESLYMELEKKLNQIQIYLDMNESEIESRIIVEPPLPPRSSEWKKSVVMVLLGSFGGLLLGICFAGYREYSDHRLESSNEIQQTFGIEVLGTVAELESDEVEQSVQALGKEIA